VAGPDEAQLLARARGGDAQAFGQLVEIHSDRVYRALRRFGLDADEAGDVAQEVFLRAWRGLDRFEERSQLSTWLYRIAFNEAQRRLSRRRVPAAPANLDGLDGLDGLDPIAAIPDSPDREPDARALEHELGEAVDAALSQLPPALRAAVILRDLEGLSTEEAAAAAGVRPAAFKSRLHRGRLALRPLLAPYLDPAR
jgi:RNA polymerase sigma-70 factor, ECF subfamily